MSDSLKYMNKPEPTEQAFFDAGYELAKEDFKHLIERDTAKKVKNRIHEDCEGIYGECPICGTFLSTFFDGGMYLGSDSFCFKCGQRIDWDE